MKIRTDKSVMQREHEQDVALKQQYNRTHHARKEDHHHNTLNGIAYSEWQCEKLNAYRAGDRPYGNADRTLWKIKDWFGMETYSKSNAQDWINKGYEVWEYNAKHELRKVHNATKATTALLNKMRVSFAK